MQQPNTISLGEAAKLAGVHKTTIARKVREGAIEGERLGDGSYRIDRASLAWIYPAALQLDTAEKVASYLSQLHSAFEIVGNELSDIKERLRRLEVGS